MKFVLLTLALLLAAVAQAFPTKGAAYYENRIKPILKANCYECHSEQAGKQKGGLLLDRRSGWMQGGDSGPAVVAHRPQDSLLISAVRHEQEDSAMPPKDKLDQKLIGALAHWVKMGAPGPLQDLAESEFSRLGDQAYLSEKSKGHWAFQPIRKSPAPKVDGVHHVIDRFIGAKAEEQQLDVAPPTDGRALLRRLTYDLTGLPPTWQEMEAFLASRNPSKVSDVVTELLSRPSFGERWGRYWLDIARYADTREFLAAGADIRYPYAYTFRDYVIRSYNEDKPVNQFIREQIAADLMGVDTREQAALGLLTVGSKFRNDRSEQINDQIDVITRGIMALTVSCARCHDHKYEAIPTADYYALHAVFNSTREDREPPFQPGYPCAPADKAEYDKKLRAANATRSAWYEKLASEAMPHFRSQPVAYVGRCYDVMMKKYDTRKALTGTKLKETVITPYSALFLAIGKNETLVEDPYLRPLAMIGNRSGPALKNRLAQLLRAPGPTHPDLWDELTKAPRPATGRAVFERWAEFVSRLPSDDAAYLALFDGPLRVTPLAAEQASQLFGQGRTKRAKLDGVISELKVSHPGAPARAMTVSDKDKPVDGFVLIRGEPGRQGDPVSRRNLTLFGGEAFDAKSSGRLEFANIVASDDNPLTARVYVNRVWMYLMGKPLVRSVGDFGLQTEPPEHLDLLNWLAASFIEDGWSTKQLIQRIVTSQTYRQSSVATAKALQSDPDNLYFARANVRRLDFEAMRDSVLAVSGALDRSLYGRAVEIASPPYSPRRTVYGHIDRANLPSMFATFDFPSPVQSAPSRPETMVPQQALFTMNDPFVMEQAKALTRTPEFGGLEGFDPRLEYLYRQLFQRDATPPERALAQRYMKSAVETRFDTNPGSWQYGYGTPETFKPFPHWDAGAKSYRFAGSYPHPEVGHLSMSAVGGHPGRGEELCSIRRWRAPYAGPFAIAGMGINPNKNGDGVTFRIVSSRHGLLGEWHSNGSEAQTQIEELTLDAGEVLSFVVSPGATTNADGFRWAPEIRSTTMAEAVPVGQRTVWVAQSDFAPPPPPPMTPWQQLAHALLMTNEFLYLD